MGAVWLAERADGQLKRQVALKLPRLAWGGGLAERLARERDILASLAHPNIARLYDAGVDQHGRPYLAMEYVEASRSTCTAANARCRCARASRCCCRSASGGARACAAGGAPRFEAVEHPRHRGRQVRLLDFGIAKLMEGDSAEETALTRLSGRALTLDYASPEQIRGEPLGTASDVYSLAVVAYELLAGHAAVPAKARQRG